MPDPDIIIRTSGEQRISNFMTWKSVYSELFFTNTLWPAFTVAELDTILTAFQDRQRRKGK
jgi:undecaprenyl diphosphate synthase